MHRDLKSCRFCGEDKQLQVITVDFKNPERDVIKCRKCGSKASQRWWNNSFYKSAGELISKDTKTRKQ